MFTGIIEELGKVEAVVNQAGWVTDNRCGEVGHVRHF